MTQLLDIFGFLSVLLRGISLSFEALTTGGVLFLWMARGLEGKEVRERALRWLTRAAAALAIAQLLLASANSAILIGTTDLRPAEVAGAGFWKATLLVLAGAMIVVVLARGLWIRSAALLAASAILAGSTMLSHSAARIEHRWILMGLTFLHHAAGGAWIGGLPYLLLALRRGGTDSEPAQLTRRFSRLAMASVALLIAAGAGLGLSYVGSAAALGGTTYGAMLLAKVILTGILLLFGALNLRIVRAVRGGASPDLLPLRRFAEAEVGIGFTVLLTAASLTSTPPAVDVLVDRVTGPEIVQRMRPRWPRMETPAFADLSPASKLAIPENSRLPGSFVPGQLQHPNTPADIAWSEYNHHWAGLVVLAMGILAVFSRRFRWARHWPLAFFGLALFLLVRADSENWPLGPRGFWESFQVAEVAQHRLFVLLIVMFAIFEWAVQTQRIAPRRAGLVFPLVCAVGGALLMTHSHSLGNVKEEFLAELSHIPLALLAVAAGWCRWLEIRLPRDRTQFVAWVWPVCFVLIGAVLILYRES
ncbi:MAG TPA: CopD family protein [Candidatus Acidoferrales bacterium]|nr:CopD family protein [Candidatus Acidoferrales bacterium]